MRWKRISVSCTEPLSAWPMCSTPVTFGGGTAMEKFSSAVPAGSGLKIPLSSHRAITRGSTSWGSKRVRDSSSDAIEAESMARPASAARPVQAPRGRPAGALPGPDDDLLLHRHRVQVAEELVGPGRGELLCLDRAVAERGAADHPRPAGEQHVVVEGVVEAPGQRGAGRDGHALGREPRVAQVDGRVAVVDLRRRA